MANELLLEIGRTLGPVVVGLGGVGGLWKTIDKILDITEAGRKRRADAEGATNAVLQKQVSDITGQLLLLTKEAAQAEILKDTNAELKKQLAEARDEITELEKARALEGVEHRRELANKDGDLRQVQAVHRVLWDIKELMDDEEGMAYLRRKRAQQGRA